MALQTCNCFTDAAVFGRVRDCGCPSDPFKPWNKFSKLCVNNLDFEDQREEIESENTRGQSICSFTVGQGGTYAPSIDIDFGLQQSYWQGSFGARDVPNPLTPAGTITVTQDKICTTDYNFADLGFVAGMVVELSGFATATNNSDTASHGGEYPHYYTISQVDFDDVSGESCLTLCVGGIDNKWIPDLTAGDTAGIVKGLAHNWQSSDKLVYADFQKVLTGNGGQQTFQYLRGALLSETTLNWTPNSFGTAEFSAEGSAFDIAETSFAGLAKESDGCDDCCETLQWDAEKNHVQVYVGCTNVCITEASLSVNRNPNREVTSCGTKLSAGRTEIEGTINALFGEGEYPAQFLEYLRDNTGFMVHKRWWNADFTQFAYVSVPSVKLTANALTTEEGECAKQEMTYKAQSSCSGALVIGGASYAPTICYENAVPYCVETSATSVSVTGAVGDVYHDVDGDNTPDATSTGTYGHSYTDGIAIHHGVDYDLEDTAWTAYDRSNSGVTEIDICSLKAATDINLSGNNLSSLDAGNLPAITTLDISSNPNMNCIDIDGSFLLTTIIATGSPIAPNCVETLLSQLVAHGQSGGTLTLDAATIYSASAVALRAQLVAAGWTVTP